MIGKTNIQKVLAFFFTYPTRELHLRQLSRETSLSMPTILAAIKKLQHEELLTIKKGRAFTLVKANLENNNFIRLKRVYNLESLYESGLVDFLYNEFKKPHAIVCFGSYSRGDDTENSDIDIGIIGASEKELNADSFEKKLRKRISLHFIDLDKTSVEFKSNLFNGIVLEGAL